jgi:hypothetical protein
MTLSMFLPNEEKRSIYGIEFGCISAVLTREALGERLIVKDERKTNDPSPPLHSCIFRICRNDFVKQQQ